MIVAIFKTDIVQEKEAQEIVEQLKNKLPTYEINFDLEDCDNILRVYGKNDKTNFVVRFMSNMGFQCSPIL
ncbi:MAG: hypothetical protein ACTJGD_04175 [Mesonia hippocampi]|uniref:hypothetical protein n=1 Tax=Mesonia hippocampi TaxID=1628250 RepID=UPI003F95BF1B